MDMLDFVRTKLECCLVIDGESLQAGSLELIQRFKLANVIPLALSG